MATRFHREEKNGDCGDAQRSRTESRRWTRTRRSADRRWGTRARAWIISTASSRFPRRSGYTRASRTRCVARPPPSRASGPRAHSSPGGARRGPLARARSAANLEGDNALGRYRRGAVAALCAVAGKTLRLQHPEQDLGFAYGAGRVGKMEGENGARKNLARYSGDAGIVGAAAALLAPGTLAVGARSRTPSSPVHAGGAGGRRVGAAAGGNVFDAIAAPPPAVRRWTSSRRRCSTVRAWPAEESEWRALAEATRATRGPTFALVATLRRTRAGPSEAGPSEAEAGRSRGGGALGARDAFARTFGGAPAGVSLRLALIVEGHPGPGASEHERARTVAEVAEAALVGGGFPATRVEGRGGARDAASGGSEGDFFEHSAAAALELELVVAADARGSWGARSRRGRRGSGRASPAGRARRVGRGGRRSRWGRGRPRRRAGATRREGYGAATRALSPGDRRTRDRTTRRSEGLAFIFVYI